MSEQKKMFDLMLWNTVWYTYTLILCLWTFFCCFCFDV